MRCHESTIPIPCYWPLCKGDLQHAACPNSLQPRISLQRVLKETLPSLHLAEIAREPSVYNLKRFPFLICDLYRQRTPRIVPNKPELKVAMLTVEYLARRCDDKYM